MLFLHARGTIGAVDAEVSHCIRDTKPLHITDAAVKRDLAILWLRAERPAGFFARLVWAWRLLGAIWRSR